MKIGPPKISEQDLKKHEQYIRSLSDDEIKELLDTYRKVHYREKSEAEINPKDGFCVSCSQASDVFYNQKGACIWCNRHKTEREICQTCLDWSKAGNSKVLRPIQGLDGDLNVRTLANKISELISRMNKMDERTS